MTTCTKTLPTAVIAAALALGLAAATRAQSSDPRGGPSPEKSISIEKPEPLSERSIAAIEEALQDERRGKAFYDRVLEDHGDVRPFSNVVRAERRHAAFLVDLLQARGLAAPPDRAVTVEAPAYASVKEACAAAVEFETKNVALYDRLIAAGPLPDDVKRVFDHNRIASLDHHKPAFERCAGLAMAQRTGHGWGHGRGCAPGCSGCGECPHACGCGHGRGHGHHGCGP